MFSDMTRSPGVHRIAVLAAAVVVAATCAVSAAAPAPSPPPVGATVDAACHARQATLLGLGSVTCRTVEAVQRGAAAACRVVAGIVVDPALCAVIDGWKVSPAQVNAYEGSWTHRALALQRGLDDGVPLLDELFLHTHNSFNAAAYTLPKGLAAPTYYPTLTNQDPNQIYSMTDQLRMDVRALEMDLHWFPSPYGSAKTGGKWVTLCHGQTDAVGPANVQIGCSIDKPAQVGFAELAAWMAANPSQFVILYLENQMQSSVQAHTIAGDLLLKYFGSYLVPTPPGQPCAPMPYETSRASLLAKGQRLLLVGNCDVGGTTSWGAAVHGRGSLWDESGDPTHYTASDCAHDRSAHAARRSFRRFFEDSTWLTEVTGVSNPTAPSTSRRVSAADVTTIVSCGANLLGLDELRPDDGRISAMVWSWAVNEPSGPGCAVNGPDGRFRSAGCGASHSFSCLTAAGSWHVTAATGPWSDGQAACAAEAPGSRFAVPFNGLSNQLLKEAKAANGAASTWLAYHQVGASWQVS